MKRFTALFLALAMVFSFIGCDAQNGPEGGIQGTPSNTASDTDFEEVVVVDNSECSIKITGIDPDGMWGYTLNAELENKSSDTTYMFTIDRAAVNGVEIETLFAPEVAPGKKANEEISFSTSDLEEQGLVEFTDIMLSFRVYDSVDWLAEDVATEVIHIYPMGEEKAQKFVRESKPTDVVLMDNEYATVIVTGYEDDPILGYTVNLFYVNKSDVALTFSADEVSVNGYMVDPFYAEAVAKGNSSISSMTWPDSAFQDNNITEVEKIEFLLRIYDEMDWENDLVKERITLKP